MWRLFDSSSFWLLISMAKLLLLRLAVVIHISEIMSFLYYFLQKALFSRKNNYLCGQKSLLKPRIARMWQIYDNSIIRDSYRDNRETARSRGGLDREETRNFCSFVLMSFLTANCANVADIR